MGKQTMATPTHTWHLNSETKIYRLQTPTSPFFRPSHYDKIQLDDYPMGTNAIVAVISYTGRKSFYSCIRLNILVNIITLLLDVHISS
jgi:DNA-directed RNA polymerase beta subunit